MKHATIAPFPSPPPASISKAIAVASGKGGVGKTWFSVTLSHALAQWGQRTLLFDADLGLANVDIQLGLMPKRDLGAVLDGTISLEGARLSFAAGGFDVIAGRSGSGVMANLAPQRLAEMAGDLTAFAENYDRVILDLSAGIDRNVRQLAIQAGTILVLTTDEPTALTDAYAFVKVVNAMKPGADIRIVVNMAPSVRDGERTYNTLLRACQSFLERSPPLAGIIRQDRQVREAIRAQVPILIRSPATEAARDVTAIAERLVRAP